MKAFQNPFNPRSKRLPRNLAERFLHLFVAEKLNRASVANSHEKRTNKFFADARLRSAERWQAAASLCQQEWLPKASQLGR